jgi:hypothetical protein
MALHLKIAGEECAISRGMASDLFLPWPGTIQARRVRRFFFGASAAPVQKSIIARVAAACCRRAALVACPRAAPNVALAALSHMLRNGLLVNQGLFT